MENLLKIVSADSAPWNLAESGDGEDAMLLRYRPDLKPFIGNECYENRLVIILEYDPDNTSGMPSKELSEEMEGVENALVSALDPNRLGVLSFVLTKYGSREWHFYVSDKEPLGEKINSALSDFPKLPLHIQIESDENWDELQAVYDFCETP